MDAIKQWSNPEIKNKICGENNGMYGKHHSEEARKKISEKLKGKPKVRYQNNVLCIETNIIYKNAATAGKELGIDGAAILKVCRGERYTCGGYHWEFVNNME